MWFPISPLLHLPHFNGNSKCNTISISITISNSITIRLSIIISITITD